MKYFRIAVPSILLSSILFFSPAKAQQPSTADPHQHGQATTQHAAGMDHDKMMSDMKTADAKLESLTAKMKSARGDAKVSAMQDLVEELVKNQIEMHSRMAMMHDHMMDSSHK